MKRYDRLIEKRFKEWELRHLGSAALPGLAHELVTPERYKPHQPSVPTNGELSMDQATAECTAEETERLGAFSLSHARELHHVPGNMWVPGGFFVEGGREQIPNPQQTP